VVDRGSFCNRRGKTASKREWSEIVQDGDCRGLCCRAAGALRVDYKAAVKGRGDIKVARSLIWLYREALEAVALTELR
jgi:hypothetical protein